MRKISFSNYRSSKQTRYSQYNQQPGNKSQDRLYEWYKHSIAIITKSLQSGLVSSIKPSSANEKFNCYAESNGDYSNHDKGNVITSHESIFYRNVQNRTGMSFTKDKTKFSNFSSFDNLVIVVVLT